MKPTRRRCESWYGITQLPHFLAFFLVYLLDFLSGTQKGTYLNFCFKQVTLEQTSLPLFSMFLDISESLDRAV